MKIKIEVLWKKPKLTIFILYGSWIFFKTNFPLSFIFDQSSLRLAISFTRFGPDTKYIVKQVLFFWCSCFWKDKNLPLIECSNFKANILKASSKALIFYTTFVWVYFQFKSIQRSVNLSGNKSLFHKKKEALIRIFLNEVIFNRKRYFWKCRPCMKLNFQLTASYFRGPLITYYFDQMLNW